MTPSSAATAPMPGVPTGVGVEQLAGPAGHDARGRAGRVRRCRRPAGQVAGQSFDDEGEPALGLEVLALDERPVEARDGRAQGGVLDERPVDRAADEVRAEHLLLEVDDALAEAAVGDGVAVVDDVRRQQGDAGADRGVVVAVEVVADDAVVDDEQGPRVVGVRRVGVVVPVGVEHLGDAGDGRTPRDGPVAWPLVRCRHEPHPTTVARERPRRRCADLPWDQPVRPATSRSHRRTEGP